MFDISRKTFEGKGIGIVDKERILCSNQKHIEEG